MKKHVSTSISFETLIKFSYFLGAISEDRKGAKLPDDDSEAAETNRKDREARSIAIEKVHYISVSNKYI